MKLVLISDIHGRSGWMWLLSKYEKEVKSADKVIFMGDYLDHYDGEIDPYRFNNQLIDYDSEFQNFKFILDYKRENMDKVILLLGNHDMEYISKLCVPCRMNFKHQQEISDLFLKNLHLFRFGFHTTHNDCLYTFSHANIMVDWMKAISPIFRKYEYTAIDENKLLSVEALQDANRYTIDVLNSVCSWYDVSESKEKDINFLGEALQHVGPMRGGYDRFGSMVWADMQDYEDECMDLEEYANIDLRNKIFQTVAHTQHMITSPEELVKDEYLCCTDCHIGERGNRPLFIWEDGDIKTLL